MVETLVALALGTLFAFGLLNMLSQTMRLTSTSANRQTAELITQTVLDAVKRSDTASLAVGSYPILVNSQTTGERGAAIHPLPVGLNMGDFYWTDKSKGNKFVGDVTLDIQSGSNPDVKIAVVSVKWKDGSNIVSKRFATMTSLHPRGVNFWP